MLQHKIDQNIYVFVPNLEQLNCGTKRKINKKKNMTQIFGMRMLNANIQYIVFTALALNAEACTNNRTFQTVEPEKLNNVGWI